MRIVWLCHYFAPEIGAPQARLLELLERHAEALEPAREAATRGAGSEAHALAVHLLERLERPDEALAQAAAWAEGAPDSPEAQFTWGRLLAQQGDQEQGREKLRRVLELAPDLKLPPDGTPLLEVASMFSGPAGEAAASLNKRLRSLLSAR